MKKVFVIIIILFVTSIANGCSKQVEKKSEVQVSPLFKSGSYNLQGVEGKIGILAPGGFVANKPNKYMWHFWGTKEELAQTPFKVEAIDLNTGEKHQVLLVGSGTVWEYNYGLGGPNNGADAHLPSSMKLPHSGKWQLDAYLGGNLFGSIVINVS